MQYNSIFYYPYANFFNTKSPILKTAALYFDKLYILDPLKATYSKPGCLTLAKEPDDILILEKEGILERIAPEEVIHKYEKEISKAIREDMKDLSFRQLCEDKDSNGMWRLAVEKVPKDIRTDPEFKPIDKSMQRMMGKIPQGIVNDISRYNEVVASKYNEISPTWDEYCETDRNVREYRYADFPLALGESIMMNQALFAGLLYKNATPVTDEEFHSVALGAKINRALDKRQFQRILSKRRTLHQIKTDQVAQHLLTGWQIDFPGFKPNVKIEKILKFRKKHGDELLAARKKLKEIAYQIEETPFTIDFIDELNYKTFPSLKTEISECKKAQKSWIAAAGIAAGTAASIISCVINPTPVHTVAALGTSLGFFGQNIVPGIEWVKDWRDGKKAKKENGLHYLIRYKN